MLPRRPPDTHPIMPLDPMQPIDRHPCAKRALLALLMLTVLSAGATGCDLLDPSNVTNPDTTQDAILDLPAVARPWLNGLERQTALIYNSLVVPTEVSTDNYANTNNFYLNDDNLAFITDQATDVEDLQFTIADLRESALFGLTTVAENDENTTNDQLAEFQFFKGLSYLLGGLYFKALPAENNGPPVGSEAHLQRAVDAFDEALALSTGGDKEVGYHLGKARAYFYLSDRANALAAAEAAIAADGNDDYVRYVKYDGVNNVTGDDNTAQDALFDRSTDDLQPLPRLDFLDPKYTSFRKNVDDEDDIPMFKIEEAYLIKAQARLADGAVDPARETMKALVAVVAARPTGILIDANEARSDRNPGSRPASEDWMVRASPQDAFRAGLTRTRGVAGTEIEIPIISGTSVDDAMVDAASTGDDALELLYLMRQEIFMAEGIRAVDFGIKWPLHENEATFNPAITAEDRRPFIPAFLPSPADRMDAFTLNAGTMEVTIELNMNRLLVENKSALPFF